MNQQDIDNYVKAGEIAKKAKEYSRKMIKKGDRLYEIAEKIEYEIKKAGGKPAFPVNLSINDIAAHFTPEYNDEEIARGLLKVDIGVHFNGAIADTAFSIDLEDKEENKKLIEASENALKKATETIKKDVEIWVLGDRIQKEITKMNFSPVKNLCWHSLSEYDLHSGVTIPNYNNSNNNQIQEGAYAIEPFATSGVGIVYDGKNSGIYKLNVRKAIRDSFARQILDFIEKEYKTLPFCSRWLVREFSERAITALRLLEKEGIITQYSHLIEKNHKNVSQAEDSVLVLKDKVIFTTR